MTYWILDFIYTDWVRDHTDHGEVLNKPQYIKRVYEAMVASPFEGTDDEALVLGQALKVLRSEMLTLVDQIIANNNEYDPAVAMSVLNKYLMASPGIRHIAKDAQGMATLEFTSSLKDTPAVLAKIASDWYELLFTMDPTRIHICEDPGCAYYFYDDSKSRTKRHCSLKCGNRMKVRRHRQKEGHKEAT